MSDDLRVKSPPSRPLMLYDGECRFCCRWVARWKAATGDTIEYRPSQEPGVAADFPEISRQELDEAVHLIETDGRVFKGAEAVFQALADAGRDRWLLWVYRKVPSYADLAELVYYEISTHRSTLSKWDQIYSGTGKIPPGGVAVRWLFLRGLAVIYLIAFVSLWVQIHGLIGARGISPAQELLANARAQLDQHGMAAAKYHLIPTIAWWCGASDRSLDWLCGIGVFCSAALLFGIAPAPMLFLLWAIYLSLTSIASPFLDFQWDTLLLETGFLAIFYAPWQWIERPSRQAPPSSLMVWLLRWLLFRLMFESGCVKLLAGDLAWWDLSALRYHYQTQPLPTWLAWYAQKLPNWFQESSVFIMFIIELVAPALIACGRRFRLLAAALLAFLQIAILLTGNYGFFNYLTLLLCVPLLDDRVLRWTRQDVPANPRRWPWPVTLALTVSIVIVTSVSMCATIGAPRRWPAPVLYACEWLQPFRTFNSYGLFRVMTRSRPEIIVEGSDDGQTWKPYHFKYKPVALNRRPQFVAPYQPRLDWQMWFAALSDPRQETWFVRFEWRLLQGSPSVLALLDGNPFPHAPPKYVRSIVYDYQFSTPAERRTTGDWWERTLLGPYVRPLSLDDFRAAGM